MEKVFCSECKCFSNIGRDWNPECLHPENKRKVDDDDWYEKGKG